MVLQANIEKDYVMTAQAIKQERLLLLYAPDLPGLIFRGFRGESDYPRMLDMINASKVSDQIERTDTVEDIARGYAHLNNCDPYRDMIFAEVDGKVIAYGRVEWNINKDNEWLGFHLAFLHPDWRRKGIGGAILRYQEAHLRQVVPGLLKAGVISDTTPRYFETFISDTEIGKEIMLDKAGYEPIRYYFTMVRPFTEPVKITPMPEGLEIRTVGRDQFRMVWDANQKAFKDHWGFVQGTERDYQSWAKDPLHNPDLWKVAWDGDQVAGMVLNYLHVEENKEYNRQRGYTEDICVLKSWRKNGLARALLTRSLQMFKDMGMDHAALGVDTQNLTGALNLYEGVGFQVEKKHTDYRKKL
jgi:ribosomal protein S18 acetylase RimI-like enzyme